MNKTIMAVTAALTFGVSTATNAIPQLELDAQGGSYDTTTETVVCANGDSCDFYAILTPPNNSSQTEIDALLADTYYVSIALIDASGPPAPDAGAGDYGSFDVTIDGVTTTINVTGDMVFGTPPLETVLTEQGSDPGDLATHGIFETYFSEIAIAFVTTQTLTAYNSQDFPGTAETQIANSDGSAFYEKLAIDTTNLADGLNLHLDLYNTDVHDCIGVNNQNCVPGDIDINDFAPFSHDAETSTSSSSSGQASTSSSGQASTSSSGQSSTGTGVPEPSTLSLLGFGILGGLLFNRRRKVKA